RRAGSAIAFTNLVVLVMPYRTVATSSRGGSIRTAEVFGSGPGWVAAGGSAVPCTWSRKGAFSASLLVDHGGYPVRVLPGGTWVCYAPAGTTVSIGS
ncbi:MAG TPA: DUF3048 C-terminal domain-containing protein, partial [Rugosimonospora sp.]|nr:DUF3048 C-terminal domain-containing protein [Rugosimonospora sp.]